jgi:hypothetical protein
MKTKTPATFAPVTWLAHVERRLINKLKTAKSSTDAARWADAWKSLMTGNAIRNRADRDRLDGYILANVIDAGGILFAAAGANLNLRTRKPHQNRGRIVTCYLILPRLTGKAVTDGHKTSVVTNLKNKSCRAHGGMRANDQAQAQPPEQDSKMQ